MHFISFICVTCNEADLIKNHFQLTPSFKACLCRSGGF